MSENTQYGIRQYISVFFQQGWDYIHDGMGYPVDEVSLDFVEEMLIKTRALIRDPERLSEVVAEMDRIQARLDESSRAAIEAQKKDPRCHVYLMHDKDSGFFKIGKADDPKRRFKQIKAANPSVSLICSYLATPQDERDLHGIFSELCVSGEWFRLDGKALIEFHEYFAPMGCERFNYTSNN